MLEWPQYCVAYGRLSVMLRAVVRRCHTRAAESVRLVKGVPTRLHILTTLAGVFFVGIKCINV